jgi:hypothetical protein
VSESKKKKNACGAKRELCPIFHLLLFLTDVAIIFIFKYHILFCIYIFFVVLSWTRSLYRQRISATTLRRTSQGKHVELGQAHADLSICGSDQALFLVSSIGRAK